MNDPVPDPKFLWIPIGAVVAIAWLIALVLVVRGDRKDNTAREALERMREFTDRMCACQTKSCADSVQEDFTKWGTEMAKEHGDSKSSKPDADLVKESTEVMTRYTECMTKVMMRQ